MVKSCLKAHILWVCNICWFWKRIIVYTSGILLMLVWQRSSFKRWKHICVHRTFLHPVLLPEYFQKSFQCNSCMSNISGFEAVVLTNNEESNAVHWCRGGGTWTFWTWPLRTTSVYCAQLHVCCWLLRPDRWCFRVTEWQWRAAQCALGTGGWKGG